VPAHTGEAASDDRGLGIPGPGRKGIGCGGVDHRPAAVRADEAMTPMTSTQRQVLFVAILASFVAFLDGTVVHVALPAIVGDLGGGLTVQQWVLDAYLITLGSLILLAGSLSDQFGRVRILRIGLLGFAATSVLCAVAPSGLFLVIARGLQGAAGALLVPSSLAMILAAFSGAAQSRAIGRWTAWSGIAAIVGPLAGGIFVDAVSWRWVFGINVAPIAVTVWMLGRLQRVDPHRPTAERIPVDYLGAVLGAAGLAGPVFALIEQGRFGWRSPVVYLPLVLGLACFVAFLLVQRRGRHPMLPLELFGVRNFWVGNVATVGIYGALSLGSFALTLFLQQVAGFSATAAGVVLIPVTVVMLALSSFFGGLAGRRGPRLFMAAGPVVAGAGYLLMLRAGVPLQLWTQLMPGIVVFGLGLAMTVAPLTSAVLGGIGAEHAGIGSAVNNAVARVAGLIAIACAGVIAGGALDLDGFQRLVTWTAGLLIASGLVAAVGISDRSRGTPG
jgi:EmrB/QacA subfamily drug resistance transporter